MVVLLAIVALFAACKGDSPTAPPPGSGGGGTIPPQGVNIVLSTSNAEPVVDSSVTVTATVTQGGTPVANGTAVEFVASAGLLDGAAAPTIKTTTNGVATVTLTSSSAGKIVVQATVTNVSKSTEVTFRAKPVTETPPDLTPQISSVTPAIGRPAGGEIIRITGKNFRTPVKVLFDTGGLAPVEGFVASVSDTVIEVVTPAVNLGAGQQLVADIIVITEAGTAKEQRLEVAEAFTFRNDQLTPVVYTVSPNSGPITGNTQIKIFGEGFQSPVQVMFGDSGSNTWTEIQVISINYGEIIAITPLASTTTPGGSGTVTGPVDMKIVNIASNTSVEMDNAFRYVAAMTITAVGPTEGPFTGGTRITIDGTGFVGPVTVTVGGVAAQPISVSGTKVVAITGALEVASCGDSGGPVVVTNIVNGDSASGPSFTYRVPKPLISAISPASVTAGLSVQVTVNNASPGVTRIKLGDRELFPTTSVFNDDGSALFTVTVPTNFEFPTEACSVGGEAGTRQLPVTVDVTYTNLETGCTNTLGDGLEILPPGYDPAGITDCDLPPPPDVTVTSPISPACASVGNVNVGESGTTQITFRNDGGQTLTIVQTGETNDTDNEFSYTPAAGLSILPGQTGAFTVTFTPIDAETNSGSGDVTVTFTTNDPDEGSVSVCVTGTGQ